MIKEQCSYFDNLDIYLVSSVMMFESKGDPNAISGSDAIGLMQIIPMQGRISRDELFDPASNIHEGCKILSRYISENGSIKSGLWAYYGKDKPYTEYADPVYNLYQMVKGGSPK